MMYDVFRSMYFPADHFYNTDKEQVALCRIQFEQGSKPQYVTGQLPNYFHPEERLSGLLLQCRHIFPVPIECLILHSAQS